MDGRERGGEAEGMLMPSAAKVCWEATVKATQNTKFPLQHTSSTLYCTLYIHKQVGHMMYTAAALSTCQLDHAYSGDGCYTG